jgi:hypothetical protein
LRHREPHPVGHFDYARSSSQRTRGFGSPCSFGPGRQRYGRQEERPAQPRLLSPVRRQLRSRIQRRRVFAKPCKRSPSSRFPSVRPRRRTRPSRQWCNQCTARPPECVRAHKNAKFPRSHRNLGPVCGVRTLPVLGKPILDSLARHRYLGGSTASRPNRLQHNGSSTAGCSQLRLSSWTPGRHLMRLVGAAAIADTLGCTAPRFPPTGVTGAGTTVTGGAGEADPGAGRLGAAAVALMSRVATRLWP